MEDVGRKDGLAVGGEEGLDDGQLDGEEVGVRVGAFVGLGSLSSTSVGGIEGSVDLQKDRIFVRIF